MLGKVLFSQPMRTLFTLGTRALTFDGHCMGRKAAIKSSVLSWEQKAKSP